MFMGEEKSHDRDDCFCSSPMNMGEAGWGLA